MNPVVFSLIAFVLLVTVVPIAIAVSRRRKSQKADVPITRFLGVQLDWAILVFGIFLLLAIAAWLIRG